MSGRIELGWNVADIAESLGGRLTGDGEARIERVVTDSRGDVGGCAFVALSGERFDGHDFVGDVMNGGAAVVVVDEAREVDVEPRIAVPDPKTALLALAARRRAELDIPVIAITGSSGKTSTKDLLAAAIPGAWASPRSYNNEIGVPLTVLGTPSTATALVLEVGSRGPGHIAALAPAVRPDVSIVTNLGVAHLEMFGSEAVLADAKYEMIGMLGPRGTAVVPDDEDRLHRAGPYRRVTFGIGRGDVSAHAVTTDASGFASFTIDDGGAQVDVRLSVAGAFQAANAAAAVAAGRAIGVSLETLGAGMSASTGSDWRMDVHRGRFTVVNDAYNANPASMRHAIETVVGMDGGRRVAVFGAMRELGPICQDAHRSVAEHAADMGFDHIVVVGEDHGYALGAPHLVVNAADSASAADTLRALIEPGDIVLVKASRASGLERLALDLTDEART